MKRERIQYMKKQYKYTVKNAEKQENQKKRQPKLSAQS